MERSPVALADPPFTFRCPVGLRTRLDGIARSRGMKPGALVRYILEQTLTSYEDAPPSTGPVPSEHPPARAPKVRFHK